VDHSFNQDLSNIQAYSLYRLKMKRKLTNARELIIHMQIQEFSFQMVILKS
jgi:hypothetical protein